MKTIRASDINTYLYCQRAWWYQDSGYTSENKAEMAIGQAIHERHARSIIIASFIRVLAVVLLLISLLLLTVYLIMLFL